jgi:hypothetical protein
LNKDKHTTFLKIVKGKIGWHCLIGLELRSSRCERIGDRQI